VLNINEKNKVSEMESLFPLLSYQMSLYNIDGVRYIFNCCDDELLYQMNVLDKSNPNLSVFYSVWKEVLSERGLHEEQVVPEFDQMVMGQMYRN